MQSNTSGFQSPTVQNSDYFKPPKRRKISSCSYIPPPKKEAAAEVKTFELQLLRSADFLQDDDTDIIPDYNKLDADVCCTGKYRVLVKTTSGKPTVNFKRFQMCVFRQLGADLGGSKREIFSCALQSLVNVDQAYKIQLFGRLV